MRFISLFIIFLVISANYAMQGDVTVSGLSSGGFMTAQMHVAFSETIKGAAVFAGGPYYCAQGSMMTALTTCMSMGGVNTDNLKSVIEKLSSNGSIDNMSNLKDSKVFVYDGTNDHIVNPKVGKSGQDLYEKLGAKVQTEYSIISGHGMPTIDFWVTCSMSMTPYINNCNYNGALTALQYLYDGVIAGSSYNKSKILKIDQNAPIGSSMGQYAFVYVPDICSKEKCAIHVVLHGCTQTIADIGMKYVENTGYNEIAEANGIIMLYPQAKKSMFLPSNPNGCWDWYGYTNAKYHTKEGLQMSTVYKLIQGLQNGDLEMTSVYNNEQNGEFLKSFSQ